ncbi:MAG: aromatic ring-hydroxylating dioxygenase subunit alpha [Thiotrichales bacterium]|nr:aromatic ring-hydroxylating dioxygenase subunit alpha [Thiotrichales bacterium]
MIGDRTLLDDWHAVARTGDVVRGQPSVARLLEEDLLLWRSPRGVEAWLDRCPHRGAKLSLGRIHGGRVVCPYHGLEYEADGRCVRVPAHPDRPPPGQARATRFRTTERYGLLWVCLGEPIRDVPPMLESDDKGYWVHVAGRYEISTSGYRAIENFLDLAHFPFVHPGLLGEASHPEVADYDVEVTSDGMVVDNARFWQPKPTNTIDLDGVDVSYRYHVPRPLTARLTKDIGLRSAGGDVKREAIMLTFAPIDEESGIGWVLLASNYDEQYGEEEIEAFTDLVIGQDLRIIESQRPKRLPIRGTDEFSLPADRASVHYRRWLRSLGVTYGTV